MNTHGDDSVKLVKQLLLILFVVVPQYMQYLV